MIDVDKELLQQDLDGIDNAVELIRSKPQDATMVAVQAKVVDTLLKRIYVRLGYVDSACQDCGHPAHKGICPNQFCMCGGYVRP